jgi:hypothetical protein
MQRNTPQKIKAAIVIVATVAVVALAQAVPKQTKPPKKDVRVIAARSEAQPKATPSAVQKAEKRVFPQPSPSPALGAAPISAVPSTPVGSDTSAAPYGDGNFKPSQFPGVMVRHAPEPQKPVTSTSRKGRSPVVVGKGTTVGGGISLSFPDAPFHKR